MPRLAKMAVGFTFTGSSGSSSSLTTGFFLADAAGVPCAAPPNVGTGFDTGNRATPKENQSNTKPTNNTRCNTKSQACQRRKKHTVGKVTKATSSTANTAQQDQGRKGKSFTPHTSLPKQRNINTNNATWQDVPAEAPPPATPPNGARILPCTVMPDSGTAAREPLPPPPPPSPTAADGWASSTTARGARPPASESSEDEDSESLEYAPDVRPEAARRLRR